MKASHFFIHTLKEAPSDAEMASHRLMVRAGMIRRVTAGIYNYMPLGLRSIRKIEAIVRQEMNAIGALELLMPAVQPAELWQASARWTKYGDELLRFKDRHGRDYVIGPTHEEVVTDIVRKEIKSYRQMPVSFYQIQTKFRDEIRPRFGVMRGREFIMKDAYSFDIDQAGLERSYQKMLGAYQRIFKRLGLVFRIVEADNGSIGGQKSHEFHVIAETGEDVLVYCPTSPYAANIEVAGLRDVDVAAGDPSPDGKGSLEICRGIEVGHVFQLGTHYSEIMGATYLDASGQMQPMMMGCYGIGITRILGAAIEQNFDARGIVWPEAIAPFKLVLCPVGYHQRETVREKTDQLYAALLDSGVDIILDDRGERAGVMFADWELIGIPHRLVISERGLAKNEVEYQHRRDVEPTPLAVNEAVNTVMNKLGVPAS